PPRVDPLGWLFAEEPGAVIQVRARDLPAVTTLLTDHGLADDAHAVAIPTAKPDIVVARGDDVLFAAPRVELHRIWSELTYRMESLRDDPDCAREAMDAKLDGTDPGLNAALTFDLDAVPPAIRTSGRGRRPRVAVLREQGVNSQREMA